VGRPIFGESNPHYRLATCVVRNAFSCLSLKKKQKKNIRSVVLKLLYMLPWGLEKNIQGVHQKPIQNIVKRKFI